VLVLDRDQFTAEPRSYHFAAAAAAAAAAAGPSSFIRN
jgi:hypothetical protein